MFSIKGRANTCIFTGPFTINVRADILSGRGLEILEKREDINYFSKFAEKLRTDIISGDRVGHETREMTIFHVKP